MQNSSWRHLNFAHEVVKKQKKVYRNFQHFVYNDTESNFE